MSYAQYVFLQEASEEGAGAKGIYQAFIVVGWWHRAILLRLMTPQNRPSPFIWSFNYIYSAMGKSSGSHVWRTLFKVKPLIVRGILLCVYKVAETSWGVFLMAFIYFHVRPLEFASRWTAQELRLSWVTMSHQWQCAVPVNQGNNTSNRSWILLVQYLIEQYQVCPLEVTGFQKRNHDLKSIESAELGVV